MIGEQKTIVILGMGGLGCPAALALAEAMPESRHLRLVLVDDDRVERSNLARQILYTEADLGRPKVEAAASRLADLAPWLRVEARASRFAEATAADLLADAAVLLDGTDSFEARFLANDAACRATIPLVHGAALAWLGQLLPIVPGRTACLRCLFEGPPAPGVVPACAEAGVASALCGVVGAAMAQAALEFLRAGAAAPGAGRLTRWDGRRGTERTTLVPVEAACSCRSPRGREERR